MTRKWQIREVERWNSDCIDLLGPGYIQFDPEGGGEFAFGAVQSGLDRHYGQARIDFTWADQGEMDEASGNGNAQLEDDVTLTGDIRLHLGDESSFIAKRWQLFRNLL